MKKYLNQLGSGAKSPSKLLLHGLRIIVVTSIMLVILLLGQSPSLTVHAQSNGTDWQIRLERVRVKNADEDDFWSDGDEPYFIVIGFRSTFNKPGSTDAFWGRHLYEVHDGADDGDQAHIHNRMGIVSFPDVEIVNLNDILSRKFPELIGAVVIAMESDATPFGSIRDQIDNVERTLEQELQRLVEQGQLSLSNPQADLTQAMNRIKSSAVPKGLDAFWVWLSSWGDPDDVIGVHIFLFAAVEDGFPVPDIPGNITAGSLQERYYKIGQTPLVFKGNGSTFEVSASIDSVSHFAVNIIPAHSGKCLDAHAPQCTQNGGYVQQWECFGSNQLNQLWTLVPAGDAYYQITGGSFPNQHKCLDVKDGSRNDGATVHLWGCRGFGKDNQLWEFRYVGNGYYQIISKRSGKCLDVAWENAAYARSNGARIQQWECYGANQANQLWRLANP
jgi:hypothetical protein